MLRAIIKSDKDELTIKLPSELIGKTLEVIAFEANEADVPREAPKKKPSQMRGFLSKESAAEIQKEIEKSRNAWDIL